MLHLLIEEASGLAFDDFMMQRIFIPLGMQRTTFVIGADTPNVATFYDVDGSEALHYTFSALAAASLYTTTTDLGRFIQAHFAGPAGEPPGRDVLRH